MTPRIAIVGGGISGLAAAYRLTQHSKKSPLDLTLFEASARAGGVLRSIRQDGFLLEGGPDCLISEKPRGLGLCKELGIESELIGTRMENRRSFILRNGQLYPVPEGFYLMGPAKLRPFLESPILSWKGKIRALAEPLISRRKDATLSPTLSLIGRGSKGEGNPHDESLASFVRRRFGQEMLDYFAQPLLSGIYAADPETLSLGATFPKFLEMEEKYGSVLVGLKIRSKPSPPPSPYKGEGKAETDRATAAGEGLAKASGARYSLFVSFKNGVETLPKAILKQLPASALHLNAPIQELRRTADGRWQLVLGSGGIHETDALCLALPAYASAALLRPLHRRLADLLDGISYTDSGTLNMAFNADAIDHPLNGFGYVCPNLESRPTMACTFTHQKFAGRAPKGKVLLRAFLAGTHQAGLLAKDDADLTQTVLGDLQSLLGIRQAPLFTVLQRWKKAMPQYTVGHIQRLLQIDEMLAELPGLQLAGNWQRGVGIPDCIESGEWAAEQLVTSLERFQDLAHR